MLFHIPLKKKEEQNLSDQNRVVIQTVSVQQSEEYTAPPNLHRYAY